MKKNKKTGIKRSGKLKKALFIFLGIIVALVTGFLALVYIPSPKFEPVIYNQKEGISPQLAAKKK
jgi:hypothetical protein